MKPLLLAVAFLLSFRVEASLLNKLENLLGDRSFTQLSSRDLKVKKVRKKFNSLKERNYQCLLDLERKESSGNLFIQLRLVEEGVSPDTQYFAPPFKLSNEIASDYGGSSLRFKSKVKVNNYLNDYDFHIRNYVTLGKLIFNKKREIEVTVRNYEQLRFAKIFRIKQLEYICKFHPEE